MNLLSALATLTATSTLLVSTAIAQTPASYRPVEATPPAPILDSDQHLPTQPSPSAAALLEGFLAAPMEPTNQDEVNPDRYYGIGGGYFGLPDSSAAIDGARPSRQPAPIQLHDLSCRPQTGADAVVCHQERLNLPIFAF